MKGPKEELAREVEVPVDCLRPYEIARRLAISSRLVRRLLQQGKLPGIKVGRTWVVRKDVLAAYLTGLANAAGKIQQP